MLICPNCDARYEVPDEVLPTSGRDVQCSNCGKTWFQYHPDHVPETADETEADLSATEPAPDDEVSPAQPAESAAPKKRELDPAVADILRQEAEVEFEARRRKQNQTLESQPDLGLEASGSAKSKIPDPNEVEKRRAAEAKERMDRMRGKPDIMAEAVASAAANGSRRELLPDIDEINSTLRNDNTSHAVDAEEREEIGAGGERKRRGGFRRGFLMVLFLFAIAVAIYIFASSIAAAVPALEGILAKYVAWVDQLRMGLDEQLRSTLGTLEAIANETSR
jgi:predicted Zn finger-like uncharacterized protein